jgi:GDP-D-mannose dehydratase
LNKKALIIGVDRKEFTDLSKYLLSKKYNVSVIRKKRNKILPRKKNLNKMCSRIIDITKFNDIFNFIKKEKFHSIYYNPKKFINKSIDKYQENIFQNNLIGLSNVLESIRILNKKIKFINIFYKNKKDYKSLNDEMSVLENYVSYELIKNYKDVFKLNVINLKIFYKLENFFFVKE